MNIRLMSADKSIAPLKLSSRETPHAVLAPNYNCSRRCSLCDNR
jgi:hypothetical protein